MTMHWWFIMRIKPTSAHEDMRIYYTIDVVSLLHVLTTYCGHLQQYVRLADATTLPYMDGDVIYTALEHLSIIIFSTNIFICILYLNIFSTLFFTLNIVYLSVGCVVLCNMSFKKHLPEYGHNRWPKHVGDLWCLYSVINSYIFIYTCWFYSHNTYFVFVSAIKKWKE